MDRLCHFLYSSYKRLVAECYNFVSPSISLIWSLLISEYEVYQSHSKFLCPKCSNQKTIRKILKIFIGPLLYIIVSLIWKTLDFQNITSDLDILDKKTSCFKIYLYTVLHMFMQVLFWAENQGNRQNFDPFLLPKKL